MTETFNPQANTVFCRKYKQDLPKMPHPPFPNKKRSRAARDRFGKGVERMA
ncbi:probable Fe(2+)-trafficking protein YggX [Psychrobacter sp. JCM 18900]|nr:probable Fe(2+)-trafficking protein YggX [Psychrobacter sp. JCM 18900]